MRVYGARTYDDVIANWLTSNPVPPRYDFRRVTLARETVKRQWRRLSPTRRRYRRWLDSAEFREQTLRNQRLFNTLAIYKAFENAADAGVPLSIEWLKKSLDVGKPL